MCNGRPPEIDLYPAVYAGKNPSDLELANCQNCQNCGFVDESEDGEYGNGYLCFGDHPGIETIEGVFGHQKRMQEKIYRIRPKECCDPRKPEILKGEK